MPYTPDHLDGPWAGSRPVRGRAAPVRGGHHAIGNPQGSQDILLDGTVLRDRGPVQSPYWALRGPGYVWRATTRRAILAEAFVERERQAAKAEQDAKDHGRYRRQLEYDRAAREAMRADREAQAALAAQAAARAAPPKWESWQQLADHQAAVREALNQELLLLAPDDVARVLQNRPPVVIHYWIQDTPDIDTWREPHRLPLDAT